MLPATNWKPAFTSWRIYLWITFKPRGYTVLLLHWAPEGSVARSEPDRLSATSFARMAPLECPLANGRGQRSDRRFPTFPTQGGQTWARWAISTLDPTANFGDGDQDVSDDAAIAHRPNPRGRDASPVWTIPQLACSRGNTSSLCPAPRTVSRSP
jgi:hypothetical protein